MRRLVLLSLLALTGLATACGGGGGDETELLGRSEARRFEGLLTRIERNAAAGRCDAARTDLETLAGEIEGLPDRRDAALRGRLREGAASLGRTIEDGCQEPEPTVEEPVEPVEPVEPEPVEPEPVPQEPVEPVEPEQPAPSPGGGEDGEGGGGDEGGGNGGQGNGNGNGGQGNGNGRPPGNTGGTVVPGDDN